MTSTVFLKFIQGSSKFPSSSWIDITMGMWFLLMGIPFNCMAFVIFVTSYMYCFVRYKQFISLHTLDELLTPEYGATNSSGADGETVEGVGSEGEVGGSNEVSIDNKGSTKPVLTDEEKFVKFNQVREEMYKAAKEQDSRIVEYESAIRRPYFHVKPLDDAQLANWHNYLDFIEKEGDFSKVIFVIERLSEWPMLPDVNSDCCLTNILAQCQVVKLHERCLIACANYPEYWIRYIQCTDQEGTMEYAADALCRATQIFVKVRS